ncbi:saccharopine dehydrogenase NADP-binding domain-containing protein [Psychrobacter sp. 16-MNA-CIBAN-0192]|uniref:saccharopine dehydrogenase family protein n=1 Tax=Psychrobacter sp. 16-MNA-CIBAN-0192 TaxID=3140448 RepID=UPI00331B20EE
MSHSSDATHSSENNNFLDNKLERLYTLILYGATSFVGQITARYLADFLSGQEHQDIKWAIAGRNLDKLEKLQAQIIEENDVKIDIIIADSDDAVSLDKMTAQTKVMISTVGPYLKYGEPLIKSCVENGTDYVDLTGEAIFIKDMLDKYQHQAQQSGARIVNSCGFDSIPSDLGVYFTQQQSEANFNTPCDTIHMRVKAAKGGLSGGTLASMATIFEEVGQNKARRQQLSNPYLLNNDNNAPNVRQDNINKPQYDTKHGRWLAPFIMATINTRIVHRSNQLLSYEYGREFKYDEAMWMQDGVKGQLISYGMSAGILGFVTAMTFKRSREFLSNHVLTKSGDGPSKSEQDNGYFDLRFFGKTTNNETIATKVTGNKDPGYGSTSQMLAQAALCLAEDISKNDIKGGFWTPASAMGDKLIERLKNHAGITFEVIESQHAS